MDILWPAMAISVIVGFVLYVLAGHWSRILRQQAGTIRRLSDRVRMIEEMDSPLFREKISESAPAPLEQVFTFCFRLDDRFWRETLRLTEDDWDFVRGLASFVGSVKLERWRSHTVATITEVLPDRKTAAWQTRSLHCYHGPGERSRALTLWELPLARPTCEGGVPSLVLSLRGNALDLASHSTASAIPETTGDEVILFRAPLDLRLLAEFRGHDPAEWANGNECAHSDMGDHWQAFYSWEDETRGIAWELRVIDLNRRIEWDRWKTLEPTMPQAR